MVRRIRARKALVTPDFPGLHNLFGSIQLHRSGSGRGKGEGEPSSEIKPLIF
jgi:hypothetical protein